MLIKLFEKIDLLLYNTKLVKRIFGNKLATPRFYQNQINDLKNKVELLELGVDNILLNDLPKPLSVKESLQLLIDNRLSMGRFGDGEFRLMYEDSFSLNFQDHNQELSNRLREIFEKYGKNNFDYISGITWGYGGDPYFRKSMIYSYFYAMENKSTFLDAKMTWRLEDVENVKLWKRILESRKLVIITGLGSHFKYSNELFEGAQSIQVAYTSPKNAWSNYESLYSFCLTQEKDSLFLISLGPTATVLCFELAKIGCQALDIGALSNKFCEFQKIKTNGEFDVKKFSGPPVFINV